MIFGFRMSIFDLSGQPSRNSRFACGYRDRCKLIRFLEDRVNACRIHKFGRNSHLKPKAGLIRFFLDHTCFVDEVRSGFRPTKSTIIRCNRTPTPDNLIAIVFPLRVAGKASASFKIRRANVLVRSFISFSFMPGSRSKIQNRKSKMPWPP
jgi:hypothetical protein